MWIGKQIYPDRGRASAPPDVLAFLLLLGFASGLLGIAMDLTIDWAFELRFHLMREILRAYRRTSWYSMRDMGPIAPG